MLKVKAAAVNKLSGSVPICFPVGLGQHLFIPLSPQVSHGDEGDVGGEKMHKERMWRKVKLRADAPDARCTLTLEKLNTLGLFLLQAYLYFVCFECFVCACVSVF